MGERDPAALLFGSGMCVEGLRGLLQRCCWCVVAQRCRTAPCTSSACVLGKRGSRRGRDRVANLFSGRHMDEQGSVNS